jgi:hypothetical protein
VYGAEELLPVEGEAVPGHPENGIVAGTTCMRWRRFLVFNALGAALWVGTWVSLGYLAGTHIEAIYPDITRYSYYLLIALAVVLAAYIARRILRRTRRRAASASTQAKATQASMAAFDLIGPLRGEGSAVQPGDPHDLDQ